MAGGDQVVIDVAARLADVAIHAGAGPAHQRFGVAHAEPFLVGDFQAFPAGSGVAGQPFFRGAMTGFAAHAVLHLESAFPLRGPVQAGVDMAIQAQAILLGMGFFQGGKIQEDFLDQPGAFFEKDLVGPGVLIVEDPGRVFAARGCRRAVAVMTAGGAARSRPLELEFAEIQGGIGQHPGSRQGPVPCQGAAAIVNRSALLMVWGSLLAQGRFVKNTFGCPIDRFAFADILRARNDETSNPS